MELVVNLLPCLNRLILATFMPIYIVYWLNNLIFNFEARTVYKFVAVGLSISEIDHFCVPVNMF